MNKITKDELFLKKMDFIESIKEGSLFIHPTDTIYGIGCDATNNDAVKKLRELKSRYKRPFSIIVPSLHWIYENCYVDENEERWLRKLPGPYTLILRLKKENAIAEEVNMGMDTIGVRIPNHWIREFVEILNRPIITTSANLVGQDYMTSIDDLDSKIKQNVDFIIYEGEIIGSPSTIVKFDVRESIIER